MRPSSIQSFRACLWLLLSVALRAAAQDTTASVSDVHTLRERFPAASIDTPAKADAALAAIQNAKERVQAAFKTAGRECMRQFLVNDCLDAARERQRKALADIDAIEVEANRYKRRMRADRLDADRARQESERAAHAETDARTRSKNAESFTQHQTQASREAAERARTAALRDARPAAPHQPIVKVAKPPPPEIEAARRAKNAADQATKVAEATRHRAELRRREAIKVADRARREQAKAAKDAAQATPPAASP